MAFRSDARVEKMHLDSTFRRIQTVSETKIVFPGMHSLSGSGRSELNDTRACATNGTAVVDVEVDGCVDAADVYANM